MSTFVIIWWFLSFYGQFLLLYYEETVYFIRTPFVRILRTGFTYHEWSCCPCAPSWGRHSRRLAAEVIISSPMHRFSLQDIDRSDKEIRNGLLPSESLAAGIFFFFFSRGIAPWQETAFPLVLGLSVSLSSSLSSHRPESVSCCFFNL